MPHALARPLQNPSGIVEERAIEEADIRMSAEGADVAERRIAHARGGLTVVQKLADVAAATAHALEPGLSDPSQLVIGRGKPGIDARIPMNGACEGQKLFHQSTSSTAGVRQS